MADAEPKLRTCNKKLLTCTGWTLLFMVLLRIAIGWHFFYEGIWKVQQDDWRATSYLVASMGPFRGVFRGMVDDVDGIEQLTVKGTQKLLDDRCRALLKHYNITDKEMVQRIEAFRDARKGTAETDPAFTGFCAAASGKLADAVYADLVNRRTAIAATQPAEVAPEEAFKARIETILAAEVDDFVTRDIDGGPANEEVNGAVANLLNDPEYKSQYALLKQRFADDLRRFRIGYTESLFADPEYQQQIKDYKTLMAEVEAYEEKLELGTTGYNKERLLDQYGRKARTKAAVLAPATKPLADLDNFVLGQLNNAYADAKMAGDDKADKAAQAKLAKSLPHYPSPTGWIDKANMWALTLVGAGLMLGLFTRLSALGGIGLLMMYYWAMPSLPWLPAAGPLEGHYLFVNKNLIEAIALAMIATSGIGRWGGLDGILFRRRRIEKATQPS